MKVFVLHLEEAVERLPLVQELQRKTGAIAVPGIYNRQDGRLGTRDSHLKAYRMCGEDDDLLVFEDDCEIHDIRCLELLTNYKKDYDIIYLGVNSEFQETPKGPRLSYGAHAMWMSADARKKLLAYSQIVKTKEIDHLWNQVQTKYKLRVLRPDTPDKYVRQANVPSYAKKMRDSLI